MRQKTKCLMLLCSAGLGGTACSYVPDGDLAIDYTFAGLSCSAALVDVIRIDIEGVSYGDAESVTASCARAPTGVTITGLAADTYDIYMDGLSATGVPLYGLTEAVRVRVSADRGSAYEIDLSPIAGTISLYWTFEGSGQCGAIVEVRVTAVAPDGSVYDDALYPCDDSGVAYDYLTPGIWTISMDAITGDGTIRYRASHRSVQVVAGMDTQYTIDLQAIGGPQ